MTSHPEEVLSMFAAESKSHLEALESHLLNLEHSPTDSEILNAAFRIMHTLKGNASVLHQSEIEWFAHIAESVMARLRDGAMQVNDELISVLLACCDHLRFLLAQVGADHLPSPHFAEEDRTRLIGLLVPYLGDEEITELPETLEVKLEPAKCWTLDLHFSPRALLRGLDPLDFLRHLATVGRIVSVNVLTDAIPDVAAFEPEICYLGFSVVLDSAADRQSIEDVFTLVRDECELTLTPPQEQVEHYIGRIQSVPDDLQTGEMLMRVGALTPAELAHSLHLQRHEDVMHRPLGSILVEKGVVAPEVVDAVLTRQDQIKQNVLGDHHLLRVPAEQLDQLGESLDGIMQSLSWLARRGGQILPAEMTALQHALEKTRQQVESLRTTHFGEQFRRLYRIVRDISQELGKRVDLLVSGGEVALDRETAELLNDVLLHLIRNAIDHGIESSPMRRQMGKPPRGTLTIQAREEGDRLIFAVSDDGAGVDLEQVRLAAIEAGLIKPDEAVESDRLHAVLFTPGFSTAKRISHYSGRGVGLDAVREAVEALHGDIHLSSEAGNGTRLEIHLPRLRSSGSLMATATAATNHKAA